MRINKDGNKEMTPGDLDQRLRISVFFVADGRPKYFTFYCARCGTKVCELSGDVVYMSDADDVGEKHKPIVVRCNGRYCRTYYSFDELST